MQAENSTKNRKTLLSLILGLIFILGVYVRFQPVMLASFPLNDGGLFSAMIETQLETGRIIPESVSYNQWQIPFAYPPLAFWLAGLIVKVSGASIPTVVQYLPAVLSSLTIIGFYFFAKEVLESSEKILSATLIFALVPRSWMWLVMGGGVTRSLGYLFALVGLIFGYRLFSKPDRTGLIATGIFTALTILSHPETGVYIVLSLVLMFLVFDRSWPGFLRLTIVGMITLIGTAPWWLTVILRHGFSPLLAAGGAAENSIWILIDLFTFSHTGEIGGKIIAVLSVLGCFLLLAQKRWYLPIWMVLTLVLLQRSGPNLNIIPVSMISAIVLWEVLFPILNKEDVLIPEQTGTAGLSPSFSWISFGLLTYIFLSLLVSAEVQTYLPESKFRALTEADLQAISWVAENIDEQAVFLILNQDGVMGDRVSEWFPYLTNRKSLTTVQGAEWMPNQLYEKVNDWENQLMLCWEVEVSCLEETARANQIAFTHIYLPKETFQNRPKSTQAMILLLIDHPDYVLIYDGEGAAVFEYQGQPFDDL